MPKNYNIFFLHIFSFNLTTGILSSVLKIEFIAKILCKNPVLQELFQKREGSGSAPMTNRSGSGSWRPKNMRIPNNAYDQMFLGYTFLYCSHPRPNVANPHQFTADPLRVQLFT